MKTKLVMTNDGDANFSTRDNWLIYTRPYTSPTLFTAFLGKAALRSEIYGSQNILLPESVSVYRMVP